MVSVADRFDQAAAAGAFIEHYFAWAAKERTRCLLIPPEAGTTPFDVVSNAIALPLTLGGGCQEPARAARASHVRMLTRPSVSPHGVHDLSSALAKLSTLRHEVAGLELPHRLAPGFVSIGCELAGRLPPASLTDSEASLFFDGLEREPDQTFKPAKRSPLAEIRFLPPLLIGERRVIHRSTLNRTASRAAELLLASAGGESASSDTEAGPSQHLLLSALGAVLKRAYAEGMRVVLSRYIPALFDSKRDRPRLTEPWVLVWKEGQQLDRVAIVWARRKGLS